MSTYSVTPNTQIMIFKKHHMTPLIEQSRPSVRSLMKTKQTDI